VSEGEVRFPDRDFLVAEGAAQEKLQHRVVSGETQFSAAVLGAEKCQKKEGDT